MCVRKLIKQCSANDAMCFAQGLQVRCQCIRIAGNIDDVVKTLDQADSIRIKTRTWRVNQYGCKLVVGQIDVREAPERAYTIQCLCEFF